MINIGAMIGAASTVGSALGGLLTSSKSGADTSKAQDALWWGMGETSNAVQRAMDAYQNAYKTARGDLYTAKGELSGTLQPYTTQGAQSMNALGGQLFAPGMTDVDRVSGLPPGAGADITNFLTQTPWYQGAMREAQKGFENSLISRGGGLSGAGAKGLTSFLGNYYLTNALNPAMANYQNYLKNIGGIGEMGLRAATTEGTGLANLGQGLAGVAMDTGKLYGQANLTQAGMQNQLAQGLASSYTNQALLDQAAGNRYSNALGSFIGTGMGAIQDIYKNSPWGQIGTGSSWSTPASNVLGSGGYTQLQNLFK